jgi:photosystem II stability/assembly factor-like uncharacterized protein
MSEQRNDRYRRFTEDFGRRLSEAGRKRVWNKRGVAWMPNRQWMGRAPLVGAATVLAVGAVVIGTTHSTSQVLKASATTATPPSIENEAGQVPDAPDQYQDFKDSSGQNVTIGQLKQAQAQADAIPSASGATPWQLTGPTNVGGRVTDLVVDNQHADTIFVAASGGGVWKSTDAGMTYTPAWPTSTTQTIGAIAQGTDGTLYAGTGEANPPGGGLTYFGDGMYKSTDSGVSWTHIGLLDSASIGRIAVDPTNSNVVYAAATGAVSRSAGQRGLYKTTDGGQTWTQVLAPPNATTGAVDVAIDPSNPLRVYAALWDHKRDNGARVYGGIGSGLFRSEDGGATWTRLQNITTPLETFDQPTDGGGAGRGALATGSTTITNVTTTSGAFQVGHQIVATGIPAGATITAIGTGTLTISAAATSNSANASLTDYRPGTGLTADSSLGRIGIAIAPSDPKRLYVVFGAPYGPDKGSYISNDYGNSWQASGRAYANGGYQWWFGRVWFDPKDENHLFNADVSLRESNDGGATWHNSSNPHSDQHAMGWDLRVPNRVYNGDDGGIYRSDANGATGTWVHATYEPWNQSYHMAVAQDNDNRLVTGLQDNGSVRDWTSANPNPSDLSQFNSYGGGDGHWVLIDPTDSNTYYSCSQNASCSGNQDNANGTVTKWNFGSKPAGNRFTTDAQIAFDPSNTKTMYVGGTQVLRSTDQGRTWTAISPLDDAHSLPGPVPPDENDLGGEYSNQYATVTTIGPSKTNPNTIYAGTDTGFLWKTTDLGVTWTKMTGLPTRWVNFVTVDPSNANHVLAAFSGYREGDNAANVYETTDGGATWNNISGNLPNAPVEMITYDQPHGNLYAATDYGVFERKNGDLNWYSLDGGLPNIPVLDVKLSGDGKWLYAATFGRSILRLPLSTSVSTDPGNGGPTGPGGSVPATLSLTLGPPASFGTFTPGVDKTYGASTTANVISTAGDATLSVADPDTVAPGHLVNGSFVMPQPLQAKATKADTTGTAFNNIGSMLNLLTWSAPVSNDPVTLSFQQQIGSTDALRTGSYSKTLTFTLSTTTP